MAQRIEALVKPEMLVWAREGARLDIETAAKKAQVTPERMRLWESGEARPTINQLRRLANAYKRPIAVFYLPEPPTEFRAMHVRDFRRLSVSAKMQESPELAFEMRSARNRRDVALELFDAMGEEPHPFPLTATLNDYPERLAGEIRDFLGVSVDEQIGWKPKRDSFNKWRHALESAGILVFQSADVKVAEVRGFSISEAPLPTIVVNNKDSVNGRIFTLFHELGHIMLREGGKCDLYNEHNNNEAFCNKIAGAVLMPRDRILQEEVVLSQKKGDPNWDDGAIRFLAGRYGVSKEATVVRLLNLGLTRTDFYTAKREEYQEEYRKAANNKKSGFISQHYKVVNRVGRLFVRLILSNYRQDNITASDVSEFLDVKLKHLPEIEGYAFKTP